MLLALGTLRLAPSETLLRALLRTVRKRPRSFPPQEASNAVWGLGKLFGEAPQAAPSYVEPAVQVSTSCACGNVLCRSYAGLAGSQLPKARCLWTPAAGGACRCPIEWEQLNTLPSSSGCAGALAAAGTQHAERTAPWAVPGAVGLCDAEARLWP